MQPPKHIHPHFQTCTGPPPAGGAAVAQPAAGTVSDGRHGVSGGGPRPAVSVLCLWTRVQCEYRTGRGVCDWRVALTARSAWRWIDCPPGNSTRKGTNQGHATHTTHSTHTTHIHTHTHSLNTHSWLAQSDFNEVGFDVRFGNPIPYLFSELFPSCSILLGGWLCVPCVHVSATVRV